MPKQTFNFSFFLFSFYAHAGAFATYASLFFAARGMTPAQIGVLMSLIQVMRFFGPNLWGWVADHTGRRVLVLRAITIAGLLSFSGIVLAHSFAQFFAAMVLLNLFTSAQAPLSEALMLAEMKGDLSNYGKIRLWGSFGFVVSVMGAAYGLDWWGVESLLWMAGALQVMVLLAGLGIGETTHLEPGRVATPLWQVLRQREVIAFFASAALMVAAHTSLYVYYSLYLERIGYSKPVIGAMWCLGVLAEIVFFYFQAHVFRRFGARRVMMAAFAVGLLRFAVIGGAAQSIALLVCAQLLHALTFAAHHSSCVMTMQRWFAGPLQARGQALYIALAYGVGGSCGGLFMAWCWGALGSHAVYYAAATLCVLAAGAASLVFRRPSPAA
ncbi:MAG: MFS transporter [Pseudomonadota bacterium]